MKNLFTRKPGKYLHTILACCLCLFIHQTGKAQTGPAGINTGVALWLKADAGISSGALWTDQSGNGRNATSPAPINQPAYQAGNIINFNPAVKFNGAYNYMRTPAVFNTAANAANFKTFAVSTFDVNKSTGNALFGQLTNGVWSTSFFQYYNDNNLYWDVPYGYRTNVLNPVPFGTASLWSLSRSTTNLSISQGKKLISNTNRPMAAYPSSSDFLIGVYSGYWSLDLNGKIGEMLVYNNAASMTASQQLIIESYLGIKWGLSLDTSAIAASGYLASDASVVWSKTANTGFNNRVTGIGRDDNTPLNQKQSRNQDVSSPGYAIIGLGAIASSNAANANTFGADKSFLLWGDNNATGTTASAVTGDVGNPALLSGVATACAIQKRMSKIFKTQVTGSVGTVQIQINLTGLSLGKTAADFYLAINNTNSFNSGTVQTLVPAASYVNGVVTFNNVTLTSGQYFTVFGKSAAAPAGVTAGLKIWLKADNGVNTTNGSFISTWEDQSPAGNTVTKHCSPSSGVTFLPVVKNFNPVVQLLNGSCNALVDLNGILGTGTYTGATSFSVAQTTAGTNLGAVFFEQTAANENFDLILPYSNNNNYSQLPGGPLPVVAPATTYSQLNVWTGTNAAGAQSLRQNGATLVSSTSTGTYTGKNARFDIGWWDQVNTGNASPGTYNGYISEVAVYTRNLTANERLDIQSYLAIKWGVSMSQAIATNYQASDSSIIWNAAANAAYKSRVTGIGRDDCGALEQKQSRNQDTTSPGFVTIGIGAVAASNAANSNSFSNDKSFEIWGDDALTGYSVTTVTGDAGGFTLPLASCGVYNRINKTYKVQETGTVGAVQVQVNMGGLSIGKNATDFYLAINNTTPFTGTVAKLVQATSYTNGIVTFDNVDFASGASQYFTVIGKKATAPANVTAGLALWLRADDGISLNGTNVKQWDDQSVNGRNAVQTLVASQPLYQTGNIINFNPAVDFSPAYNYLYGLPASILFANATTGTQNIKIFVAEQNAAATYGALLYEANSNTYATRLHSNYIGLGAFFDAPYGYRTPFSNTTVIGKTNIWTAGRTPAAISLNNWGALVSQLSGTPGVYPSVVGSGTPNGTYGYLLGAMPGYTYAGKIGEMIVYNNSSAMTAAQQSAIQSYLSIKWGASLSQAVATNYLASDASVIWNGTTNATYKNRVTGIGRDDCSDLSQKQSRNQDVASPGFVTMGLGTIAADNASNPNTFAADKNFEIWGDDGVTGIGTATITGDLDGNIIGGTSACKLLSRLSKTFKVQETGTVGVVQVQVDITGVSLGKTAADFNLAINTTTAFTGTVKHLIPATSFSGNVLTFDNVDFANGDFFTVVGTKAQAPANVTTGLKLWIKADQGVTVPLNSSSPTGWADQGPLSNNLVSANANSTYLPAGQNFNPTVSFPGGTTGNYMYKIAGILHTANYSGGTAFSVARPSANVQSSLFMEEASNGHGTNLHLPWSDGIIYSDVPGVSRISVTAPATTLTQMNVWTQSAKSGAQKLQQNNKTIQTGTATTVAYTGNNSNFFLAAYGNNPAQWGGVISEIILYTNPLTANQTLNIQSYLAVKWGVSLDQTTPVNYQAADSSIIWNGTTNATYKNRVTGIGRDDCSDLNQKQSRNQDLSSKGYVTMGLGTVAADNASNTNMFAADKNFELWGDDGVAGTSLAAVTGDGTTTLVTGACRGFSRLAKTFKVQETGIVGAVQVQVNMTGISIGKTAADFYLAINNSAAMTGTISKLVQATSYSNGMLTFDGVDFNDGDYFTVLGQKAAAPANITAGLALWLKAEDGITLNGTTVSQWDDQSINFKNAVQGAVASQATYLPGNSLNFNPSLKFSTVQSYAIPSLFTSSGTGNFKVFTTTAVDGYGASGVSSGMFGELTANTNYVAFTPSYSNGNFYFDGPLGYRTTGAWGSSFGRTNLYTLGRSATVLSAANARKTMGTPVAVGGSVAGNGSPFYLGQWPGQDWYNGRIGEVIVYNNASAMTANQQLNIESYLAVKWGVSLDQTTATNYQASDSSIIWNGTTNATYKNRVTGIGRDDCSDLNQKQSRNQDTTTSLYATMGLGTIAADNAGNSNAFAADKNFDLWGDDGLTGITTTTITGDGITTLSSAGCKVYSRLAKTFKVQETGTVPALQVRVKVTGTNMGKLPSDFYLAINNSATMTGAVAQLVQASSYSNGVLTFDNVDFDANSSQYFTVIGQATQGPAGLTAGLKLWIKADVGTTLSGNNVTAWDDNSPAGNGLLANNPAGTSLTYVPLGQNFNPVVNLGGANYLYKTAGILGTTSYSGATTFSVVKSTVGVGTRLFFEGTAASNYGLLVPYTDNNVYSDIPAGARINTTTAPAGVLNQYNIWTGYSRVGSQLLLQNGKNAATPTALATAAYTGNNSQFYLGSHTSSPVNYQGNVSEVILYTQALTANQRLNIQSYLAVKWGVSLDQATATNYQAADSSIIWNGTTNATYKNRVTGIGRDDCSDLNQLQSVNQDVSSPGYVTMGLGAIAADNAGNTNAFTDDKTFELWGDDGVAGTSTTTVTGDGTINLASSACRLFTRLGKTFKVQETGSVGNVQLKVNMTGATIGSTAADYYLAINNSATFAGTISKLVAATSYTNGILTFDGVDFNDGDFFTIIGQKAQGPANITAGLKLWIRADQGVTLSGTNVTSWDDQGVAANNLTASVNTSAGAGLNYVAVGQNFNPIVDMDNTSGNVFYKTGGIFGNGSTYTGATTFSVLRSTVNDNPVFSEQFTSGTGNFFNFFPSYTDNNTYLQMPATAQITAFATPATTLSQYNVWTGRSIAGSQLLKQNGKTVGTGSNAVVSYTGATNDFYIGWFNGPLGTRADTYTGKVSEVIIYSQALTANQQLNIQSYLALKWGVSMDQTTTTSYQASDSSVIWDKTVNAAYNKRVTGIGRDDCSDLNQLQSINQDVSSPGYVTMGLGSIAASNATNTNTFAGDKTFEIWGDDGVSGTGSVAITGDGTTTLPNAVCGSFSRMAKTYKVQETGLVGGVQVNVNLNGLTALGAANTDFYLAVNSSNNFAGTVTQLIPATAYVGNVATFNNVDFNTGDYFTVIGKKVAGPANVAAGLKLWIKADAGVTLSGAIPQIWADNSAGGNDLTSSGTGLLYNPISQNFNPTITFPGGAAAGNNTFIKTGGIFGTGTYTGTASFSVLKSAGPVTSTFIAEQLATAGAYNLYYAYSDGKIYNQAPNTVNFGITAPATLYSQYNIWTATAAAGNQTIQQNAKTIATGATASAAYTGNNSNLYLGSFNGATVTWGGNVSEVIIYSQPLTANQQINVQSYLGLKWGVSIDQAAATNYQASDSSIVWNATTNATYKNRITGIGRDDCGSLNQLQSRNQDTVQAGYVTIGLGNIAASNAANTNTFAADKSFEIWGDDGVAGRSTTAITDDGNIVLSTSTCRLFNRLAKTYKVQETGTVGAVQVQVNMTGLAIGKNTSDFYLAINTTNSFTGTVTKLVPASSYSSGVLTFDNVDFANGNFFTVIGQKAQAPANVTAGLALWLKAEDGITLNGTTVSGWDDQSAGLHNGAQATAADQPTYLTGNAINFNPAIQFDNGTDNLTTSSIFGASAITNPKIFSVGTVSATGSNTFYSENTSTTNAIRFDPETIGNFYFENANGTTNRITGAWGGTFGIPDVWMNSFTNAQMSTTRDRKSVLTSAVARTAPLGVNSNFMIGGYSSSSGGYLPAYTLDGKIGELVVYKDASAMTANQQLDIESYLAIKWGISLDQTTPNHYQASDSTIIWDKTTNAAYSKRITGIGRDDCSDLDQRQSRSQDTTGRNNIFTIGLNTVAADNASNTTPFTADKNFLVAGDDNGAKTLTTTNIPLNVTQRLTRLWKADVTGSIPAQELKFDLGTVTGIPGTVTQDSIALIIDTDGDGNFLTGTVTQVIATSYASGIVTFDGVNLPDGAVFTVALKGAPVINVKVLLQGALMDLTTPGAYLTTMRDDLRHGYGGAGNVLPLNQPYNYTPFNYAGPESAASLSTFTTDHASSNDDIVDWILIELRDATTPTTIVYTKALLLTRDGNAVDPVSQSKNIVLPVSLTASSYYISVRHRNHFGVMFATPMSLGSGASPILLDFTDISKDLWNKTSPLNYNGYEAAKIGGKWVLWAGNGDGNGTLKYQAPNADITSTFTDVTNYLSITRPSGYGLANGYFNGDFDMNGKAKFQAPTADIIVVFNNVTLYTLNVSGTAGYGLFQQQLP